VTEPIEVTINGEPAYLYKVSVGAYSDYRESWYWHRSKFTDSEMIRALLEALPPIETEQAAKVAAANAYTQEKFGVDAGDVTIASVRDPATGISSPAPRTPKGTAADYAEWEQSEHVLVRWWEPRERCLAAAGFVQLEPTASWGTDEPWGYKPGEYQHQLEEELNIALAEEGETER
jgi:hypothetical protein